MNLCPIKNNNKASVPGSKESILFLFRLPGKNNNFSTVALKNISLPMF